MVKTAQFHDRTVPVPGLGCMSFSNGVYGAAEDAVSKKTLAAALDLGCTFWDTAVLYGAGHNETLLGEFFKENPGAREKVTLASKCAFVVPYDIAAGLTVTNSPEHIAEYIENTRSRLGSYPDIYYLHRIDPDTPLEQSIPALNKLKTDGKIKYIGLSECGAATLRAAHKIAPIDVIQIEYSPFDLSSEENGLMAAARELGIPVVGYSPLGRGMLTGTIRSVDDLEPTDFRRYMPQWQGDNFAHNVAIADKFIALAQDKGCTASQLVLAWVAARGVVPIFGTRTANRVKENFGATDVVLSDEEKKAIDQLIFQNKPKGLRYPEQLMKTVGI